MKIQKILIILMVLLSGCTNKEYHANVIIVNASSNAIKDIKISLCDDSQTISSIETGSNVPVQFKIGSDCHFNAKVIFKNGNIIDRQIGYVTNGFNFQSKMKVTDSDITLEENVVK